MSWSVSASGKAPEVLAGIKAQFEWMSPCSEPEERVRLDASRMLGIALESQDPETVLTVSAFGSQRSYDFGSGQRVTNSLSITVSPEALQA